jgi:hypothetical protein
MTTGKAFPPEVKELALSLFPEHGGARAAKIMAEQGYEVPGATIRMWASQAGISGVSDSLRAGGEVAKERWAIRRARMADELGEVAEMALVAIRDAIEAGTLSKGRDGAGILAILVDKASLLSGDATRRTETVGSPAVVAQKAAELDQLAERRRLAG